MALETTSISKARMFCPALIRKFHEAKQAGASSVTIWGTGNPLREFLHVDDLADAAVFLMERFSSSDIINVGSGEEIGINQLAHLIADAVGFRGEIVQDTTKPDGAPRKLLDVSKLQGLGWKAQIGLAEGVRATYDWYCSGCQSESTNASSVAASTAVCSGATRPN